ncbi:MAG: lysylphosphatidylglycerol synthase transmembrane domain-containing protein [Planctomycetota bacterium]
MKKRLSLLLRIALALAGLAYIGFNLDWVDRLEFPAGYVWSPGQAFEEPVALEIVAERPAGYRVRFGGDVAGVEVTPGATIDGFVVARQSLGTGEEDVRYRPAVQTMLRQADVWLLLAGLSMWLGIIPLQVYRWWSLLRCQGLHTSYYQAFKLTMVGMFFNICMPGATGGDVMKAYYAAKGVGRVAEKGEGRRTAAVISVFVDRLIGLIGLVVLAGLAGLLLLGDPDTHAITAAVWVIIGGLVLGSMLYFTRLRRWLGLDKLIAALPGKGIVQKVDSATHAYGSHRPTVVAALGVSVAAHTLITTSIALAGMALGVEHTLGFMIATLPLVLLAQAVPLFPLGLGVADAAALKLLAKPAMATANQVLGLMLIQRLYLVFYALIGSLVLVRGDIALHGSDRRAEAPTPPRDRRRE